MLLRIFVFYVLAFFFLMLLGGLQQAAGLPQEIGLPQWGPGLAALLMLLIFRKDTFKIVFFSRATPFRRYLYAALVPLAAALVIFLIAIALRIQPAAPTESSVLPLILSWMPFGALGEELGWRGYLHKKLGERLNGLASSLIVGLLWFPIHISFFGDDPIVIVSLALVILSYSVVIYALVKDSEFSVLLATVFHLAINLGNLLYLKMIHEPALMGVNALVWISLAVLTVVVKRDLFFATGSKH